MIFNNTITLFNYYKDENNQDCWKKTVLKNVMFKRKHERIVNSEGILSIKDYISLTIPERENFQNSVDWVKDKKGWTLDSSHGLDIVLYGEILGELGTDYTLKELKRNQGYLGVIRSVSDNTIRPRLKHWKVIAI